MLLQINQVTYPCLFTGQLQRWMDHPNDQGAEHLPSHHSDDHDVSTLVGRGGEVSIAYRHECDNCEPDRILVKYNLCDWHPIIIVTSHVLITSTPFNNKQQISIEQDVGAEE